jgi:tripartite-type tricarboxylate transporter receptor subunit TctC
MMISKMERIMSRRISISLSAFAWPLGVLLLGVTPALARPDYPSRPVKIVVPFLAGGSADIITRLVFNKVSEKWNQPVVIESKPGAGGNIGADAVAKSEPNGYTLLSTAPGPLAINQYLYDKMPFDPAEAFAPVSLIGVLPNVLVVGPSVKSPTLKEWLDEAMRRPDKFSYASQGVGTTGHLTGAMLNEAAGLALRHIPYRGFPPALTDVIRGQVDMMFIDTGNALPRVGKDGLRALGVSTDARVSWLPDVPTFKEIGLPKIISSTWFAVIAPARTSDDVRQKISGEIARAVALPELRSSLDKLGVQLVTSNPKDLQAWIDAERVVWSEIIRGSNIKADQP